MARQTLIQPIAEIPLGHRAYHWASSPSGYIVAATGEGHVSIIDPTPRLLEQTKLPVPPESLALSPDGAILAVVTPVELLLLRTDGLARMQCISDSFLAACFSADGDTLWTAVREDDTFVRVEARSAGEWRVLHQELFDDPFGDSFVHLFPHPLRPDVAIWVAAGQDGQAIFWAALGEEGLEIDRFGELDSCLPPSFDDAGDRVVTVSGFEQLLHNRYPGGEVLTRSKVDFGDLDLAEESTIERIYFAGTSRAIAQVSEGRLVLIDLHDGRPVGEVVLAGHEPRAVTDLYPTLRGEAGLCTDLCYVSAIAPGRFASVHRELPGRSVDDWRDRVVLWDLPLRDVDA